eukprot:TRINITY_DN778039_c0_g1_i1.p1 TRINITY_DN778039_c0_g1~~TRINITY_DN778039_c0_g1_i1.p1  ORF type:complete len:363 (-),score=60.91 TRINITY_DN778039_c0_g1_i1:123-1211(-)
MKKSYRQAGTSRSGTLVKGPPLIPKNTGTLKPRPKRAVPSIPSKFETILHIGNREKAGFGSRIQRFKNEDRDNIPGPGEFHKSDTLEKMSDSISRKGYGNGFVSKTSRFDDDIGDKRYMPGPGSYNPPIRKAQPMSFAENTAIFRKPRYYRDDPTILPTTITPGPGAYITSSLPSTSTDPKPFKQVASSTFRSKTKRNNYLGGKDGPSPGQYDPQPLSKSLVPASASFKSTAPKIAHDQKRIDPGPGSYLGPEDNSWKATLKGGGGKKGIKKVLPSSSFCGNGSDRFSRQTGAEHIGPGSYETEAISSKPSKPSHTSVFSSKTQRGLIFKKHEIRPPGPAYYKKVEAPSKKTYMLNLDRKWI